MTGSSIIHPIDLNFMGVPGVIAVYLIQHSHGAVLVECGPGSTIPALQAALSRFNLTEKDITDVLLTHIHLDHAGAAGWFARQGARIHVHPNGASHLLDPTKLIDSATRIYGEQMGTLWGEFLPVLERNLSILSDNVDLEIDRLCFRVIDSPGHAKHHLCYLFEGKCFTGDVGGVRLAGTHHIRLPMPPPDLNLEQWRATLEKLRELPIEFIIPTHYGLFPDVSWHLDTIESNLNEIENWMETLMPTEPPIEVITEQLQDLTNKRALRDGLDPVLNSAYEADNPIFMSAQGISRYWHKFRSEQAD